VPKEFIPGVEKGLEASRETGVLAGFPVIDFKATLVDGNYHDVDSSVLAFEIAARAAFRDGLAKAQCKLLEPIMKVEVVTPDDYTGAVTGDISSRRGHLEGQISRGGSQIITAMVPLSNMFGYSTDLRSRTQGRATYSMHFEKYAEAPRNVSEEVVARVTGKVAKD
jgi:elongation factor G